MIIHFFHLCVTLLYIFFFFCWGVTVKFWHNPDALMYPPIPQTFRIIFRLSLLIASPSTFQGKKKKFTLAKSLWQISYNTFGHHTARNSRLGKTLLGICHRRTAPSALLILFHINFPSFIRSCIMSPFTTFRTLIFLAEIRQQLYITVQGQRFYSIMELKCCITLLSCLFQLWRCLFNSEIGMRNVESSFGISKLIFVAFQR